MIVNGTLNRVTKDEGIFVLETKETKTMPTSLLPTQAKVGDKFDISIKPDGDIRSVIIRN
ncbi:hypothetical protein [Evansella clarkii]|uniref:hypothetical protein n=1 Tax=Evansella clarkii TaxID=79879 RepID=UPI00099893FD|nr:hypothetical protein [Evansella clarkii]